MSSGNAWNSGAPRSGLNQDRDLPDDHPSRRFEVYAHRAHALACLEGRIPEIASGKTPRGPRREEQEVLFRRRASTDSIEAGNRVQLAFDLQAERNVSKWEKLTGRNLRPEYTDRLRPDYTIPDMSTGRASWDDLLLVPDIIEDAEPTARGIIEERQERIDHAKTGRPAEERIPVYHYAPKPPVTSTKKFFENMNLFKSPETYDNDNDPDSIFCTPTRIPPKARALLGSPTKAKNDFNIFKKSSSSGVTSPAKSFGSLKRSASQKVTGLFSPAVASEKSRAAAVTGESASLLRVANNKVSTPTKSESSRAHSPDLITFSPITSKTSRYQDNSPYSKMGHNKNISTPDKSAGKTPASAQKNGMPSTPAGATERSVDQTAGPSATRAGASAQVTPIRSFFANTLGSLKGKKTADRPPTPPKKDTPPEVKMERIESMMVPTITEGTPSRDVDYSEHNDGDAIPGGGYVYSGMPLINRSASDIRSVYGDVHDAESIAQELATPPLATRLFHSPNPQAGIPIVEEDEELQTPTYDTTGLVAGKFLPATTYNPYSPSVYPDDTAETAGGSATRVPHNSPAIVPIAPGLINAVYRAFPSVAQDTPAAAGAEKHQDQESVASSGELVEGPGAFECPSARPQPLVPLVRRGVESEQASLREEFVAGETITGLGISGAEDGYAADSSSMAESGSQDTDGATAAVSRLSARITKQDADMNRKIDALDRKMGNDVLTVPDKLEEMRLEFDQLKTIVAAAGAAAIESEMAASRLRDEIATTVAQNVRLVVDKDLKGMATLHAKGQEVILRRIDNLYSFVDQETAMIKAYIKYQNERFSMLESRVLAARNATNTVIPFTEGLPYTQHASPR